MRPIAALMTALAFSFPAGAQDVAAMADPAVGPIAAGEQRLDDFLWTNRLAVVFSDSARDPAFLHQIELLLERPEMLADRDVLILTDTDPAAGSPIRTALRPNGFSLVLIDKNNKVLFRKPSPRPVREITRAIDKTPLRQEEMRDSRGAAQAGEAER